MDNETLIRYFYPSDNQLFHMLCGNWYCHVEEWCRNFLSVCFSWFLLMIFVKQIFVYHLALTVFRYFKGEYEMSCKAEETSNHFHGSTSWTNNFWRNCIIWKHLNSGLLFNFWHIQIYTRFVPSTMLFIDFAVPNSNFFFF